MKKFIVALSALFLLTACPKEKEVKEMEDEITQKKSDAVKSIQGRDYSLDGLLKAQDYFFNFSEKVHLMIVEPEGAKNIQKLIAKRGMKNFCSTFVMPVAIWKQLEDYCSQGQLYKCSPEIKEYEATLGKFKELIGSKLAQSFNNETACNN